ncbi:MAG: LysE family transporter [Methanomicrobiales archaeon]|nr:LysE family transporter [Methanomicrobiales archaeon]NYT21811.1 LysE family transporter [Methanomicrobiales archaeon]
MLALGFLIGLTGALAPGPTLVATIDASMKGGWSMGPRVTLGHIAVEIIMVLLIVGGFALVVGDYAWLIGGIGGTALILFGVITLYEARTAALPVSGDPAGTVQPFLAGVVTSISNPYFWIWWFTVGSALLIGALSGGIVLVIAFIAGHWMADLGWFTLVSTSVHRGRFVLDGRSYRWILGACGFFLIVFGGTYLAGVLFPPGTGP